MRAVIFTTMWKRPELTEYMMKRINKQRAGYSGSNEYIFLAVGSEGDESKKIAERNGFNYVESQNLPLNRKNNVGSRAAKQWNPDAVIYINSDSLFSWNYFDIILEKQRPMMFVGIRDLYNMNLKKRMLGYWSGWNKHQRRFGEPIGTGRCFGVDILEMCDWELWSEEKELNKGLDYDCTKRLEKFGIGCDSYLLGDLGAIEIEVKTDINIWKWGTITHRKMITGEALCRILSKMGIVDIFSELGERGEIKEKLNAISK